MQTNTVFLHLVPLKLFNVLPFKIITNQISSNERCACNIVFRVRKILENFEKRTGSNVAECEIIALNLFIFVLRSGSCGECERCSLSYPCSAGASKT